MSRKIDLIVIHCSDSPDGRTLFTGDPGDKDFVTPIQEIDLWHRERGFIRQPEWRKKQEPGLTSIGYHFVIYTGGAVAACRHLDEIGAHVHGHNAASIGICMIGRDQFSTEQWRSLRDNICGLARSLEQHGSTGSPRTGAAVLRRFNNPAPSEAVAIFAKLGVRVVGHCSLNNAKTCPNFNVTAWLEDGMKPPTGKIFNAAEGNVA